MSRSVLRRVTRVGSRLGRSTTLGWTSLAVVLAALASCADTSMVVDLESPEARWENEDPRANITAAGTGDSGPVAGTVLPDPVMLRVVDRNGRPFSGLEVTWSVADSTAGVADATGTMSFSSTVTSTLNTNGESTVFYRASRRAGTHTIEATVTGPRRRKRVTATVETVVEPGPVTHLTVDPPSVDVGVTEAMPLTAATTDVFGNPVVAPVTWASTNEAVATVDPVGVVTAHQEGTTVVTAATGTLTGTATVAVTNSEPPPPPPPTQGSLAVSPRALLQSTIGQVSQLSVSALDGSGSTITPAITWRSSNPAVATVDATGRVTAASVGTTYVTASSACCTQDSAQVTVQLQQPPRSGELDWFCDWRMSTAATQAALRGRNQTGAGGTECFGEFTTTPTKLFEFLDVMPNPGMGFPAAMTNVLRVAVGDYPSLLGSPMLKANDVIPTPAVGESVFFRTYDHLAAQPGDQLNIHVLHVGTQDRNSSPYTMRWFASGNVQNDGTFFMSVDPQFQTGNSGRGQGRFLNNSQQGIPQRASITRVGQTFRREWRITRTGTNTAMYAVRVYDAAGTLLATEANYFCTGSEAGGCFNGSNWLQDRLGQNSVTIEDWSKLAGLELGNNGSTPDDPAARRYWYWGGLAVRVSADPNDWIGTYPVGREGN